MPTGALGPEGGLDGLLDTGWVAGWGEGAVPLGAGTSTGVGAMTGGLGAAVGDDTEGTD